MHVHTHYMCVCTYTLYVCMYMDICMLVLCIYLCECECVDVMCMCDYVSINMQIYTHIYTHVVVVCTHLSLSWKVPHKQVIMNRIMTSGNLGGEMVSTLARTCFRSNMSHVHHSHDPGSMYRILYKLQSAILLICT